MLKNLYILAERTWGVKSSEVFADLLYLIFSLSLVSFFLQMVIKTLWPVFLILSLFIIIYLLCNNQWFRSLYAIGFITQVFFFLMLLPIGHFQIGILSMSLLTAALLHFFLDWKFQIRIAFVALALVSFGIWKSLLQSLGLYSPIEIGGPNVFQEYIQPLSKSFAFGTNRPDGNLVSFSLLEELGGLSFALVAFVSFRRTILLFHFPFWICIFGIWSFGLGEFSWLHILSYSSFAFFVQLGPGRNHYASFFVSFLSLLVTLLFSFFIGHLELSAGYLLALFFGIEAIFIRLFLGK